MYIEVHFKVITDIQHYLSSKINAHLRERVEVDVLKFKFLQKCETCGTLAFVVEGP